MEKRFKIIVVVLFLIGAATWGWIVKQMPMQFLSGFLFGAFVVEMYYWKVTKQIKPGIND